MSCEETQPLLHGYLDRELDLAHSLEVERHLQACPACTQEYQNLQALRAALNDDELFYKVPPGLEHRLHTALRHESRAAPPAFIRSPWVRLAFAAGLMLLGLVWGLSRLLTNPSGNDVLAQEVTASHVRSLMVNHLADVPSTDQHTVKPWFAGKIDFSPPVTDLAAQGFPLTGGRLDYLDGRPVAALVYRRQRHIINLFVWPAASDSDHSVQTATTRQGYHLIHWTQAGMTFWAVSDLNSAGLTQFARLQQSPPPANSAPSDEVR